MVGPTILHVDMDAFYASVEILDDPSLAGRPLVVGGTGRRGVVAACSYEARAFGVRSAMPAARARALCPQAIFVAGRHDRYQELSAAIHAVFADFTPLVEGIALDEAFLDVTGAQGIFGPAPVIARQIRGRIGAEVGLPCSVGVAPSKFLAKLASEAAKPRATRVGIEPGEGVVVVEPGEELAFLRPLPIEALWGVGPATAARLRRIGLLTVGALAEVDVATLESAVGRAHGRHLHRLASGVDERRVEPERAAKSVGHEETYATDRFDPGGMHVEILRMADSVASRLRAARSGGRTVTLKVRYGDFKTLTRSQTGAEPLDSARAIATVAWQLLDGVDVSPGVRLLGVSVSNLSEAPPAPAEQLRLRIDAHEDAHEDAHDAPAGPARRSGKSTTAVTAGEVVAAGSIGGHAREPVRPDGWAAASDAVEEVRRRFGPASVGPAALIGPAGLRVKRPGDTQWGPSSEPGTETDRRRPDGSALP